MILIWFFPGSFHLESSGWGIENIVQCQEEKVASSVAPSAFRGRQEEKRPTEMYRTQQGDGSLLFSGGDN